MSSTSLNPNDWLTAQEIAAQLQVVEQTVRNWIEAGKLPAYKMGRAVRIKREDFEAFTRGPREPAPKQTIWDGLIMEAHLPDKSEGHDH